MSAEWVSGKPQTATEEQVRAKWGSGFWCKFCGYRFKAGDYWRFVSATHVRLLNFKVCRDCDAEDEQLIDRMKKIFAKHKTVFGYPPEWEGL